MMRWSWDTLDLELTESKRGVFDGQIDNHRRKSPIVSRLRCVRRDDEASLIRLMSAAQNQRQFKWPLHEGALNFAGFPIEAALVTDAGFVRVNG